MVQEFGLFCENHGLEVITNEVDSSKRAAEQNHVDVEDQGEPEETLVKFASAVQVVDYNEANKDGVDSDMFGLPSTIEKKSARPSCLSKEAEKLQAINRMSDLIRGYDRSQHGEELDSLLGLCALVSGPAKIVVAVDSQDLEDLVIVAINANDRPGLLLLISRGLQSLGLNLHHTEASVVKNRSMSIWRCGFIEVEKTADSVELQAVLSVSLT